VIAIGASAGGLHALAEVLRPLPRDFPSSILVVQHLDPHHESLLTQLLRRGTAIRVKQAEDGEAIKRGVVYVAPPDQHLLVGQGQVQLAHTKTVHFSRPSIDLLFESVAAAYGEQCIGLVLSGSLRDGAAGIRTIKSAGGTTLVEDPDGAEFPSMPLAALATGSVDLVIPLAKLGAALMRLCGQRQSEPGVVKS
jgi:two-component system chemotaxis response regulator CheB